MATVYREVWTNEAIKGFTRANTVGFLNGVKDQSRYVSGDAEAQVIHMVYLGVKPEVLINNTTYPIPIVDFTADDVAIQLNKYQTKVTAITDDELYALSYNKIQDASSSHVDSIIESRQDKAVHAFAPASTATKTPVLKTTGADDGTGRKRLTWSDLVRLRAEFGAAKIPVQGMRVVLCSDHVNDLLLTDQKFKDQYYARETGAISNQLGFEMYEYANNPLYTVSTGVKTSFGTIKTSLMTEASVVFHPLRVVQATGITKFYWSKAETDPQNQRNLINYRHYHIALPVASEAIGAIYSDLVPAGN